MRAEQHTILSDAVACRNALVLRHQHLVRPLASVLHRRLPAAVDLADLVQTGMLGLIQAAESFDHRRGVPFAIFARQRVRGAMLDSVRRRRWLDIGHGELVDVSTFTTPPDEAAIAGQAADELRRALLRLPIREQRLLIHHIVHDAPLRVAGAGAGVSKTRARQLVIRALATLRRLLAG